MGTPYTETALLPKQGLQPQPQSPKAVSSDDPLILTDIYQDDVNIAIWKRRLGSSMTHALTQLLEALPFFQRALTVSAETANLSITEALRDSPSARLVAADMAKVIDMFCCLFGLEQVGVRLALVDRAMCPRFHVDHVPCRLVTTYTGPATQWLPHDCVDRSRLGGKHGGLPDEQSGLMKNSEDIRQMACGDVAILKGELWAGNENAGLVHRSPGVREGQKRLVLTLDFQ